MESAVTNGVGVEFIVTDPERKLLFMDSHSDLKKYTDALLAFGIASSPKYVT
jgi:hypothetical protein